MWWRPAATLPPQTPHLARHSPVSSYLYLAHTQLQLNVRGAFYVLCKFRLLLVACEVAAAVLGAATRGQAGEIVSRVWWATESTPPRPTLGKGRDAPRPSRV
ncbi:hypothetical protein E2C01_001757 [Portunus trituberculatus]|uniref:Uncharacterized protein n=1 Tax=Portunus trituberculatus TaxID=210409 RepID=A0A5B7CK99_PORTR|nr:hypothetical protein [Portunus trituberculatus]